MQFVSVFLDVTKAADFRSKLDDVSRTQEVCHVTYIFSESSLGNV